MIWEWTYIIYCPPLTLKKKKKKHKMWTLIIFLKRLKWKPSLQNARLLFMSCIFLTVFVICQDFWKLNSFSNLRINSVQFSSVAQSCPTLCDLMNCSTPGLPIHQQLLEFIQTLVHRVGDAIHPSLPLSSFSPPALNPSQHQCLFKWDSSSHEVAKVLEFQLQHQSFQ